MFNMRINIFMLYKIYTVFFNLAKLMKGNSVYFKEKYRPQDLLSGIIITS
jgi:hypothetical protein